MNPEIDIKFAKWVPFDELPNTEIEPEHKFLMEKLIIELNLLSNESGNI